MPNPLGRKFFALVLAAAALLALPATATTAGQIVIYGAHSGSTLELSTSANGQRIIVTGNMAHAQPHGCHFTKPNRMKAVCRASGSTAMEVVMGPQGDFVRVGGRLPLPLTIHLGAGSDKFIGGGERDTCYSEGARRNRCIGRGGNDVCITGPRNSDCVGGGGNDFCHTGTGSDGCWGGPGRDICIMGPGQDGCHGEGGRDRLFGGPDPDQLYGGRGSDYCDGGPGVGKSHTCNRGPGH